MSLGLRSLDDTRRRSVNGSPTSSLLDDRPFWSIISGMYDYTILLSRDDLKFSFNVLVNLGRDVID